MRVALTVWEDRISPVFDSARMFLVAEIENSRIVETRLEPFNPEMLHLLADNLTALDINVMICGAISQVPAHIIEGSGVKLIPFIKGVADEVLMNFAQGRALVPKYSMPGCGRRERRRRFKQPVPSSERVAGTDSGTPVRPRRNSAAGRRGSESVDRRGGRFRQKGRCRKAQK